MNQKIHRILCWCFCFLLSFVSFGSTILYSNRFLDYSGETAAVYIRNEQRNKGNFGVGARISFDSYPYGNLSAMRSNFSDSFGDSFPKEQKGFYFLPNSLFSPFSISYLGQKISVAGLSSCKISGGSSSMFDFSYIGSTGTFSEDSSVYISEELAEKLAGSNGQIDKMVGQNVSVLFSSDDSSLEQTLSIVGIIKGDDSINHFEAFLDTNEFLFFPVLSLNQIQHLNSASFFTFFGEDIFEISQWYSLAYSFSLSDPHLQFGFYSRDGVTFKISEINQKIQESTAYFKSINKWCSLLPGLFVALSFSIVFFSLYLYRKRFKQISYSFYFSSIFGGLLLAVGVSLIVFQFFFFTDPLFCGISKMMALYLLTIPVLASLLAKNLCNEN